MIVTVSVLVVLLLAFAVPSVIAARQERQRRRRRQSMKAEPAWWPQFEREFRAYVGQLELQRRHADARPSDPRQTRRPDSD